MESLQRIALASSALDADLERYLVIRGPEYKDSVQADLTEMVNAISLLQENPEPSAQSTLTELSATLARLQNEVDAVFDVSLADASSGDVHRQIVAIDADIEVV